MCQKTSAIETHINKVSLALLGTKQLMNTIRNIENRKLHNQVKQGSSEARKSRT